MACAMDHDSFAPGPGYQSMRPRYSPSPSKHYSLTKKSCGSDGYASAHACGKYGYRNASGTMASDRCSVLRCSKIIPLHMILNV